MSKHDYLADRTQPRGFVEVSESEFGAVEGDDPIPDVSGMALECDRDYTENVECTRDTGTPVYVPLRDLVGLYVEEVTA
ncbi:MAG: hypothetical protein E7654_05375 [Ruminococcaceae bacterium]|nr:hypothetical protein [Oscillospiraceae bacterium]